MTPPWFLEKLTAADWQALGVSTHRQVGSNLAERVRAAGVDAVAAAVAGRAYDDGWSMRPFVREQIAGYLADVKWNEVTSSNIA